MPAAYRSSTNASATATSITLNKPAGCVDGDYLLAAFTVGGGATINSVPSGWTQDFNGGYSPSKNFYVYKKVASGEPASWNWGLSGSVGVVGACVCVQSPDASTPLNASNGQTNASSANVTAPSITTTSPGILVGFFSTGAAATFTPPGTMTEVQDIANGSNVIEACHEALAATGPTGTRVAVASAANANAGWIGLVADAAVGGASLLMAFP